MDVGISRGFGHDQSLSEVRAPGVARSPVAATIERHTLALRNTAVRAIRG